jgi:hypothetical protein
MVIAMVTLVIAMVTLVIAMVTLVVARVPMVNFVSSVTILTRLTAINTFCEVCEDSGKYSASDIIYFRNK